MADPLGRAGDADSSLCEVRRMTARWDPLETARLMAQVLAAGAGDGGGMDRGSVSAQLHGSPLRREWSPPSALIRAIVAPMAGRTEAWDAVGYLSRLLCELHYDELCEDGRVFDDDTLVPLDAEFVYVRFLYSICEACGPTKAGVAPCSCLLCGAAPLLRPTDYARLVQNATAHFPPPRRARALQYLSALVPSLPKRAKAADGGGARPKGTGAATDRRPCIAVVDAAIGRLLGMPA